MPRTSLRNRLEYWGVLLLLGALAWTPLPVAQILARCAMRLLDLAVPKLRRVAETNLAFALPGTASRPIIDGLFRSLARSLVVFSRFPRLNRHNIQKWIRYDGLEHFTAAKARGRGVLFYTAHLGNWELSAFSHALMSEPMYVVVRPLDNPLLDRLSARYRSGSGNRLIEKKEYARTILKALAANEAVGILADQNAGLNDGVFVDFFGVPACAHSGFARLAAHSGAAVIPGFALWSESDRRYVLRFYPPVEMTGDVNVDTQRMHAQLEAVIREHPDQWLWIHRKWKTRPPGEAALYS